MTACVECVPPSRPLPARALLSPRRRRGLPPPTRRGRAGRMMTRGSSRSPRKSLRHVLIPPRRPRRSPLLVFAVPLSLRPRKCQTLFCSSRKYDVLLPCPPTTASPAHSSLAQYSTPQRGTHRSCLSRLSRSPVLEEETPQDISQNADESPLAVAARSHQLRVRDVIRQVFLGRGRTPWCRPTLRSRAPGRCAGHGAKAKAERRDRLREGGRYAWTQRCSRTTIPACVRQQTMAGTEACEAALVAFNKCAYLPSSHRMHSAASPDEKRN